MTRGALKQFHTAAGKTMRALWGDVIVVGGVQYQAALRFSAVQAELENDAAAVVMREQVAALVSKADMPVAPAIGARVQARGKRYELKEVANQEGVATDWLLRCVEFDK